MPYKKRNTSFNKDFFESITQSKSSENCPCHTNKESCPCDGVVCHCQGNKCFHSHHLHMCHVGDCHCQTVCSCQNVCGCNADGDYSYCNCHSNNTKIYNIGKGVL